MTDPRDTTGARRAMRGFFAGTIGRPVALMVCFLTLIVVGVIAYRRIPIQLFPSEFAEPQLHVWVANPGSNARENEEHIARPIEEQLRTLSGIEETRSYSNDGYVQFSIDFGANVDMDMARAEVRDRIERAWPLLPETAETAGMWSESADSFPISFFGITVRGDPARRDYLMDKVVVPRLEAIQGIGNVEVWGVLQDSVRILLDEEKVAAAQLDLGQVIGRLASDNFAMPLGEVKDGGREIFLRSDMRFRSPEEIAEFPIREGLKVSDVGRVARVKSVDNMVTLIDGDHAYWGMATKDSQSNVVETSRNLRRAAEELENDPLLDGAVSVNLFFVQGDFIESALDQMRETAVWGGALAVLVLFVFLRRVRLTLCVALSIPVSTLLAIAWEYFGGGSFNLLTMTGLTLGVGMLVDNSVVVVENIARIHAAGQHPLRAAVLGSRQIALAVTLATLTTVVVFLPLIFMTDNKIMRVIFGSIGIPLSISLLASLLVAVVFLPVITARLLGKRIPDGNAPGGADGGRRARIPGLAFLLRVPVRAVAWCIGGVRAGWHLFVLALFYFDRAALRVLKPARWVVAALAAAAGAWAAVRVGASAGSSDALEEFGVPLAVDVTPVRVGLLVAGLVGVALSLFGLARWRRRPSLAPARPASFVPASESLVAMAVESNHRLVAWTLRHRLAASSLAALGFLSILVPMNLMTVSAFGEDQVDDDADFRVSFEADFTLAEAREQIQIYADEIEKRRDELDFEHWTCRYDEDGASFSIYFGERRPDSEVDEIEARLERELPRIPGHRLIFYNDNQATTRSKTVASFVLIGPDSRELERLGTEAQAILATVDGLSQVTSPLARAPEQIEVEVDREMAIGLGVTSEAIQNTIAWVLGGWPLPRFQEEGREIPLVVEYDDEETAGLATLRDLSVYTSRQSVALSSFANLSFTKGARSITRRNGQTTFTLQAKVDDPLQIIPVTERAYTALGALELPRGYSWDRSESAMQRTEEEFQEMMRAFMLSVVLVFLLMGILFESLLLPFSVLFTIPFAAMGAMWTLFLTGTPMDSFGWIGLIILAGVVVNNGIVLIDRIHGLRGSVDRAQAVVLGCSQRVRPVLMTALTTVCGLTPMMLTEPAAQSMVDYRALATIVAGGLIASTFFTLWVVPLAYTILDDLARCLSERARWWLRKPGSRRDAPPSASDGREPLVPVPGEG